VGDTVPALALRTLGGDSVRVGAGGPVTLVNVWATWCTACREEMADLESLHRDFASQGLRVLAVSVDQGDGARVRRFASRERLTMPIAHDPTGLVQELYQVMAVPETYLVGGDGRLLWRQAGGLHGAPDAARDAVARALEPATTVAGSDE
jgi:peroxiredoxin